MRIIHLRGTHVGCGGGGSGESSRATFSVYAPGTEWRGRDPHDYKQVPGPAFHASHGPLSSFAAFF
jgi:hypothetical protein